MTFEELRDFRRELHANPEVSTQEKETQERIYKALEKTGLSPKKTGGTGLLVHFKSEKEGNKVLLRADIDALPIEETNDFEYRSIHKGVSHKCGHDGHAAIMLGVAAELATNKPERGEVCLVFQPAEENGKGARAIIEDPEFDFKADMAFALHNLPGYPMHQVVCRKGAFTAAAKSVILKLHGKTSHAAEPERGINPGLAIAEILQLSEELSEKDINREDFRLITLVHVNMGEKAYGISAGYGEVHLTLRTFSNQVMEGFETRLMKRVEEIIKKYQLQLQSEWLEVFYANMNNSESFEVIRSSADENQLDFEERATPFKWGEDFGLFTEKFPGAMFGIGSGKDTPALHNPDYDFPDEIITTGIKMFTTILRKTL
ncbi:MAG TPA: amidohydrolase [Cryomorphaceae bacterium]|mgnify:CR=1 FL=1|nr:amidohydrolase [Owenweeksia sp.]HAD97945.1 amidohydrolase [Cryomorphaceae bacterium]HBF21416.1 amidohydrolase [Cryomorphaceae bacterium]HCQ16636.1 amidohydrolase [Cryomorphaceae bacterium]|tara:strand:+ start:18074 stop:19195 length:1122 start_codon:yes stop_codon:yes gene_type:complete